MTSTAPPVPAALTQTTEALVARCLVDPGYLTTLLESPTEVPDGATELDLRRVRLFGGLITKVQHNDLWQEFPYTRAALKLIGVELALFADYRDPYLRLRATSPNRATRIACFLNYLLAWAADHKPVGGPTLRSIAHHERMLWQVRTTLMPGRPETEAASDWIEPAGLLRVVVLDHNPADIIAAIRRSARLDDVPCRTVFVCYWGRPQEQQLRVIEVDALTALILAEIGDGIPPARLLGRFQSAYAKLESARIAEVLRAAGALGMLTGPGTKQTRGAL